MTDRTDHETTRQQQAAAASLLIDLLDRDMPPVYWVISCHVPGTLEGIIAGLLPDDERRAQVADWADAFGAKPDETVHSAYTYLGFETEVDDVKVQVYTHVDRKVAV